MWPFKHKCKKPLYATRYKTPIKASLITGVPIQVGHEKWFDCECGKELEHTRELGGAGLQQISWGADPESLWDEGPIRELEQNEVDRTDPQDAWNFSTEAYDAKITKELPPRAKALYEILNRDNFMPWCASESNIVFGNKTYATTALENKELAENIFDNWD